MTYIDSVSTGISANDGTGDSLRDAFTKINAALTSLRSDLTTAPHVMILGDSLANHATDTGSNANTYHGPRSFLTWLQVLLGFPFHYEVGNDGAANATGDNAGISGDTTTGMLARLEADVLSRKPDIVFFIGGTNDIKNGGTYATVTSNLEQIFNRILAQGAMLAVLPVLPRQGTSFNWDNSTQRNTHHHVNHWIRNKARRTQGMLYLDVYPLLMDPASTNGDMRAIYTTDGVHTSSNGGLAMALAIKPQLEPLLIGVPALHLSPSDLYHATENPSGSLLVNGILKGTAGSVSTATTGTVADSWRVSRNSGTNVTIAASKISHPDGLGGDMQRMVMTTTGGGTGTAQVYFSPTTSTITTGVATGVWYEALCEIAVSASGSGNAPIEYLYLELWDITTGGSLVRCLHSVSGDTFPDRAWSGVLKTPPLQTVGTDGIRWRVIIGIDETVSDTVTVDIGRATMRRLVQAPALP